MKHKLHGTKRQILMRTEMMIRELNIRHIRAYRNSMSLVPCHFMPKYIWRLGGRMQR